MTGAPLPAEGPGAPRRRPLTVGVMLLCVVDVLLSPIFVVLMGYAGNFSMTMLSVEAVLMIGILMCFVCPITAIMAGLQRASKRLVLVIALLPVLALPAAYAMLKALGTL